MLHRYVFHTLLFAACILLVSACSVTPTPDDSTIAPHQGSQLIFANDTLNTNTRARDTARKIFITRDTITGGTISYQGNEGVFAIRTGRINQSISNLDTTFIHYETNGDVSIYRPVIKIGTRTIPGRWLRLPYGVKINDSFSTVDSSTTPPDNSKLTASWNISFIGPELVPVGALQGTMVPTETLNTIRARIVETVVHTVGSEMLSTTDTDVIYSYSPKLGYIVQENTLTTENIPKRIPGPPVRVNGRGRTLQEYHIN